jgi:thymidine kinase
MKLPKTGLTFIVGNMFGGKTSEWGRILSNEVYNGRKVQAFKTPWDNRYGETVVKTHDGAVFEKIPTTAVKDTSELVKRLNPKTQIIGIDEIQFFDENIFYFIKEEAKNYHIIATGLQLDFRGNPFPLRGEKKEIDSKITTSHVISLSTNIIHMPSYCRQNGGENICGETAVYIQRFKEDGSIAPASDPTVVVGGSDLYSPRCEKHFLKPK